MMCANNSSQYSYQFVGICIKRADWRIGKLRGGCEDRRRDCLQAIGEMYQKKLCLMSLF